MLDISELQWDIKDFKRVLYWANTNEISQKRCNLLEAIIKVTKCESCISQGALVELIRICNICMNSYIDCSSGYFKQWKHYRQKFVELLDRETLMYVDGVILPEHEMVAVLCYTKIITESELRAIFKLKSLFRAALYRCINKTYSVDGTPRPIVGANNKSFKVFMGQRRVPARLILGYMRK